MFLGAYIEWLTGWFSCSIRPQMGANGVVSVCLHPRKLRSRINSSTAWSKASLVDWDSAAPVLAGRTTPSVLLAKLECCIKMSQNSRVRRVFSPFARMKGYLVAPYPDHCSPCSSFCMPDRIG